MNICGTVGLEIFTYINYKVIHNAMPTIDYGHGLHAKEYSYLFHSNCSFFFNI